MPAQLGHRRQLSTEEANSSRLVTKVRWIVESRNGHIKTIFKIFRDTLPNCQIPNIRNYIRIACAIINKFHPLIQMHDGTIDLAQQMLQKSRQPDLLQARIITERLLTKHGRWKPLIQPNININFPILNLDYLRNLTFGTFQLKMSPSYVKDNEQQLGNTIFEYDTRLTIDDLLRVRVRWRHGKAIKYQLAILYNDEPENPITGYYCTWKSVIPQV